MTSAIGSVAAMLHQQQASSVNAQQVQPAGGDSDGDNDGSKPGQVDQSAVSALSSGTIGGNINTTA